MKKEFGKIILSILITMLLTFFIKFINLTSFKKANDIVSNRENNCVNDILGNRLKKKKLLMIITAIIMLIIGIIMWLYSIGFCYIYYHSQKSWFYSGIWSLFWVWVIFAPLFLFLISLYENITDKEEITYYIKRLICF